MWRKRNKCLFRLLSLLLLCALLRSGCGTWNRANVVPDAKKEMHCDKPIQQKSIRRFSEDIQRSGCYAGSAADSGYAWESWSVFRIV